MSMPLEVNPFRWNANVKTLVGVLTIVGSIVGSAWTAANYIGLRIYAAAATQTRILDHMDRVEGDIKSVRDDLIPRVKALESDAATVRIDAAVTKSNVANLKGVIDEIKGDVKANLAVSRSHDDDIKATRQAVAPTGANR